MALDYLSEFSIKSFIQLALAEDVGDGDHSTLASIPKDQVSKARLLLKEDCVIAGVNLAEKIFKHIEPNITFTPFYIDGKFCTESEILFEVEGLTHTILKAERLALNCMQRMSGIATLTQQLSDMISHTKAKLLDTRKTTPNFRMMEKWAVVIGKGMNHRYGLYDAIMLKDNHIDASGSITKAISNTLQYLADKKLTLDIIVEVRNLKEVDEALTIGGFRRLLLDNMTPQEMKEAVVLIGDQAESEASGGITEKNIVEVAECGVDYISLGALTHSAASKDMSLKIV